MSPVTVPFVDLAWQHEPLQAKISQAITAVIERGDFVLGQALTEFETAFAQACDVNYAVGVASGTDAIAIGLQASGIEVGDEVLVPANTFVASLIGILKAGATPVLVDCHPQTALIDLTAASRAVTPKTKAILPVHLYGQMVSPQALLDFADAHHLLIFEDAAQAHLAQREGYRAGAIGIGGAFSFYPSKNLGAFGNGGIVVTQDEYVAKVARSIRNYGAPRKYFHDCIGTNSRLDTIQAAILNIKLPHLVHWNQLRNQAATYYNQQLASLKTKGLHVLDNQSGAGHVYHLYIIRIGASCRWHREQIRDKLGAVGIQTGIHYPTPCHLQPAYTDLGYQAGDFPQSERLCEEILSLPMFPGIQQKQLQFVNKQLSQLLMVPDLE